MLGRSILFLNAGYCAGLNGSLRDYVFRGHRQLFPSRRAQHETERKIIALLRNIQPDVCCFAEVTSHSFERIRTALRELYPFWDAANKYGPRLPSHTPFLRHRQNGILLKEERPIRKHCFSHGLKRLLYEVDLGDGISLFTAHFPLSASARQRQFHELRELLPGHGRTILCGDFNIFRGFQELDELTESSRLRIVNGAHDCTYPACKPAKALDLFLCSPAIAVRSLRVIFSPLVSDHLPVLLIYSASG